MKKLASLIGIVFFLISCKTTIQQPSPIPDKITTTPTTSQAIANMQPLLGNQAKGAVQFLSKNNSLNVIVNISGTSAGEYKLSVHNSNSCTNFEDELIIGSVGNLYVDKSENITEDIVTSEITFQGEDAILGRALVLYKSTHTENTENVALACGVIKKVR